MNEVMHSLLVYNELPRMVFWNFTAYLSTDGNTSTGYGLFNATVWFIGSLPFIYLVFSFLRWLKGIRHNRLGEKLGVVKTHRE